MLRSALATVAPRSAATMRRDVSSSGRSRASQRRDHSPFEVSVSATALTTIASQPRRAMMAAEGFAGASCSLLTPMKRISRALGSK